MFRQAESVPDQSSGEVIVVKQSNSAIIAGCGYTGRRVAAVWLARGIQVYAITRSASKADDLRRTGITPIQLNLADATALPLLPDADVVLWSVGFDQTSGVPRQTVWIDGLRRILNALPTRLEPRRIIYTSSTSVYGSGHGQDVNENTLPSPISEGGIACLAAETLLQNYSSQTAASISILRLAGIYGPDRLLRKVADLKNGTPILSPPDEWLNLIHVDDAAAMIDSISQVHSPPKLVNVVARNSVTRREYYSLLASLANAPPPVFAESSDSMSFRRGGNRRVVSLVRDSLPVQFRYDSIEQGLPAAYLH